MNKPKKPNAIYDFLTKDNGKNSEDLAIALICFFVIFMIVLGVILSAQNYHGVTFG